MTAAGVEPDVDQAGIAVGAPLEFQTGIFHALALFFDGEDLVLAAVLEEEILPVAAFRGRAVDHGHIFLHHRAFLYRLAEGGGGLLGAGVDHNTAHVQIQPVDGEDLAFQCGGDFVLRVHAHRLDDHIQVTVSI